MVRIWMYSLSSECEERFNLLADERLNVSKPCISCFICIELILPLVMNNARVAL